MLRRIALIGIPLLLLVAGQATPAQAASQACTTLWPPDGKGSISICKTWTKHSGGKGYYGEYWGTMHGKNVVLEAWWDGRQERIAGTGDKSSSSFNRSYNHLERVYFRACKRQTKCSGDWW